MPWFCFISWLKSLCFSDLLKHVKNNVFGYGSCELGKYHVLPFNNITFISSTTFDLMQTDISESSYIAIIGDTTCFVIFIYDHSCFA